MLRNLLHKLGLAPSVLITTLIGILFSVGITWGINYYAIGSVDRTSITISIIVPLMIGPIFSWAFLRLISQLDQAERQLRQIVMIDQLTGAHTRRHFFELAPKIINQCNQHNQPVSMAVIDIDKFKELNDSQGHLAGDNVLRCLGLICADILHPEMLFSRFGGDEFIILAPNTTTQNLSGISEEILKELKNINQDYSLSIGIASTNPPEIKLEKLIANADKALYEAKKNGGHTVESVN